MTGDKRLLIGFIVAAVIALTAVGLLVTAPDGRRDRITPTDNTAAAPVAHQPTNLPTPLTTRPDTTTHTPHAVRGAAMQLTEPPVAPTTVALSIEQIIRKVWPDGPDEDYAVRIAWRESGHQPDARNRICGGLFQIYFDVHRDWLDDFGIYTFEDLFDPWKNTRAALALRERVGWSHWSTHR